MSKDISTLIVYKSIRIHKGVYDEIKHMAIERNMPAVQFIAMLLEYYKHHHPEIE